VLSSEEKAAIAKDAEKSGLHPIVMDAVKEFTENAKIPFKFPYTFGLAKIVNAAVQVTIAYERGIDPDELLLTKDEKFRAIMEQAKFVAENGGEVLGVILDDTGDSHLGSQNG
jgi:hypothetical protein